MRLGQRLNSFRNKKFDEEGLKLRTYPKWGIYKDKEKGWGELFEEISVIVEFYMFIYGIKEVKDVIDYQTSVAFEFINLFNKEFIESLRVELGRVFRKKVSRAIYGKGNALIRIYLDSDLVL